MISCQEIPQPESSRVSFDPAAWYASQLILGTWPVVTLAGAGDESAVGEVLSATCLFGFSVS